MNIKTMAEDSNCELLILGWMCRFLSITVIKKLHNHLPKIMQKANMNFRILGTEEKCNGDTARRLGNEYLAQMMMIENIETLEQI
ncbi:MAG: heterodisulfide reductase-related iron-sulfur binding cluster [Ignavibacteriales bacterium]|nr:heterodisulfide reductase-related iron-sulfur binding cluster [Ignavibacteriales bacterium]